MVHRMGLAKITLGEKSGVYNEKYFLAGEKATYNWIHDSQTSTVYSSTSLTTGQGPYNTNNTLYYIMNGTTTFTASNEYSTDDAGNGWTISSTTLGTVSNGNVVSQILPTPALTAKIWTSYTIAVGDVFYSDGALSHYSSSLYSSRTPIGIVCYLGNDAWTEASALSNKAHALVISLKDAANSERWQEPLAYPGEADANLPTINTGEAERSEDNASGLSNTITLVTDGHEHPAASTCYNYSVSRPSKSTRWFLPSFGQWWKFTVGIAGALGITIDESKVYCDLSYSGGQWVSDTEKNKIADFINTRLAKGGNNVISNYDIFDTCSDPSQQRWVSTQFDAPRVTCHSSSSMALWRKNKFGDFVRTGETLGNYPSPYGYPTSCITRPFLAF